MATLSNNTAPQWGIFDQNNNPVLVADSVFGVEYAHDWQISDYPQEQGAFASYNKVQVPWVAKVQYLIGDPILRAAFLKQAEVVCASLNLVSVITPDIPYMSANPIHAGYKRTGQNGVTLILVEVWCEQIRIFGSATTSNTASPNGATPAQNGTTQPGPQLSYTPPPAPAIPTPAPSPLSPSASTISISPTNTITTSDQSINSDTIQFYGITQPPITDNLSDELTTGVFP